MLDRRALKDEIDFHFIGPQLPSRGMNAQPSARGGLTARQQRRIAEFIEENLAEDLRLATLARFAGLSSYHFARAFKQSFGVPPHRYHTGRRIERAKTLLQGSSRSVTEVALAVGFAETSSFSAAFRKFTGVAPSDYRRGSE
jgi:AraC family transcriptional regulator